ncbi:uncharacterized protein LOC126322730 [Schistocerca gregaria]|uniref:uncharacterized protein LOC126322730 n=1 Tax=Schistocerca gregaria TaxID=7010 RepID=UPI00211E9E60|nr:uncharacterized protein LOC126322730 [Schistocerca gregaria]
MMKNVVEALRVWWLGSVEDPDEYLELRKQFMHGHAPEAVDLIQYEDGQKELDQEFQQIYSASRAEDPNVEAYFTARDQLQRRGGMRNKLKTRIPYYIPIIYWLPKYSWRRDFVNDLIAGIGVSAILIPQALAYSMLAGVEPISGLYTGFFPLLMYCLMGTSKQLSMGPDALATLLLGTTLPKFDAAPEELFPLLSFTLGLFLLLFGIIRVGFLDNVLSKPLLCGFVNAVALTILIEQMDVFFGMRFEVHGWRKILAWWQERAKINWVVFMLGVGFVCLMNVIKLLRRRYRLFKYMAETLIVMLLALILTHYLDLDKKYGVDVLGNIGRGFAVPTSPNFHLLFSSKADSSIVINSLLIAIVGFIEHIVIAKHYSSKYNYQISPNRELVAVGCSNLFGSFFQTYPTFGSLPRSAIADNLNAKSQIFALVSMVITAFTILFFTPYFSRLPRVAMSAIICVASFSLFEVGDIRFLWGINAWKELLFLFNTFVLGIVLGIELGIFISLGISIFFIIKTTTYPHITILGYQPATDTFTEISAVDSRILPGIIIIRIEDPLYFANIMQIKTLFFRLEQLGDPKAHPALQHKRFIAPTRAIIIHARNVLSIDASATQVLSKMLKHYKNRNIFVAFVKLRQHLALPFMLTGAISNDPDGPCGLYNTLHEAVEAVQRKLNSEPPPPPPIDEGFADQLSVPLSTAANYSPPKPPAWDLSESEQFELANLFPDTEYGHHSCQISDSEPAPARLKDSLVQVNSHKKKELFKALGKRAFNIPYFHTIGQPVTHQDKSYRYDGPYTHIQTHFENHRRSKRVKTSRSNSL